jgi:RimJ/RimL family protein N-acetyltransferase/GNAT superfamily N-acetyltransferase
MRIERLDVADDDLIRACYDVMVAAHEVDEPVWPAQSLENFRLSLAEGGRTRDPHEVWVATGSDAGSVAGWVQIALPQWDNTDRAWVFPVVAPASRRRGIGTELLRHTAARVTANGRSAIDSAALHGSAGAAFAAAAGATVALDEARRVLDLRKAPGGEFARLRATAAERAAVYRVVTWTGPTPEQYVEQIAGLLSAMNDAPAAAEWEDERWDADRVRQRWDGWVRVSPSRVYSAAALHEATGEMAALTQIRIDPTVPSWGNQGLTVVTRPHRGHRLGLLVKAAMLEWLADAEPALERIGTGNAPSNQYMIAVNEELGYELVEPGASFYQLLVADVR